MVKTIFFNVKIQNLGKYRLKISLKRPKHSHFPKIILAQKLIFTLKTLLLPPQ